MHCSFILNEKAYVAGFGKPPHGVRFAVCFSRDQVRMLLDTHAGDIDSAYIEAIRESLLDAEKGFQPDENREMLFIDTIAAGSFIDMYNRYQDVAQRVGGGANVPSNWEALVRPGILTFLCPDHRLKANGEVDMVVGAKRKDGTYMFYVIYSKAQAMTVLMELEEHLNSHYVLQVNNSALPDESSRGVISIGAGNDQFVARAFCQFAVEGRWLSGLEI